MILSLIFFSLLPILFWFFFYFKKKFISLKLILFTFLKGLILFLILYLLEINLIPFLFPSFWNYFQTVRYFSFSEIPLALPIILFLIIAPLEEAFKFFVLKNTIFKSREINQIIDGVQLGIILGLGFAAGENLLKFSQVLDRPDFQSIFFLRFFISTLALIVYSGIMGYYLALARFHKLYQPFLLKKALIFPVILHGLFNFFILTSMTYLSILMLVILTFIFYKWYNQRRLFEIRLEKQEIPIYPPFLSEKIETDVYLSKVGVTFNFIKKIGLDFFGYQKPKPARQKTSKNN